VGDVAPAATAFAHREQNFSITKFGSQEAEFHRYWDRLREHTSGLYLNFETDQRPQRLHDAFPEPTLTRLRTIKAQYDPDDVFDQVFSLAPANDKVVHEFLNADPAAGAPPCARTGGGDRRAPAPAALRRAMRAPLPT
jgi:hypothetical protein